MMSRESEVRPRLKLADAKCTRDCVATMIASAFVFGTLGALLTPHRLATHAAHKLPTRRSVLRLSGGSSDSPFTATTRLTIQILLPIADEVKAKDIEFELDATRDARRERRAGDRQGRALGQVRRERDDLGD